MGGRRWRPGLALLAAMLAVPAGAVSAANEVGDGERRTLPFDPAHSRVGFHLRTRWGQRLRGGFPAYEGEVRVGADGRREVWVRLDSTRMEIEGHRRFTRWARGPEFFDIARFPGIEFRSETYDDTLLREGGSLHGTLTMRGQARSVRFVVEPATCDQPGVGCDVVASGVVDRTDFGMDGWRVAVGDAVRFELRVRTRAGGE